MYGIVLVAIVGAFVPSLVAAYAVRGWSRRVGFVDHPRGHKAHESPTALAGGIGLIVSIGGPILAGRWHGQARRSRVPPRSSGPVRNMPAPSRQIARAWACHPPA